MDNNMGSITCGKCGHILNFEGIFWGKICPKCGNVIESKYEFELQKYNREINEMLKQEAIMRTRKRFYEQINREIEDGHQGTN